MRWAAIALAACGGGAPAFDSVWSLDVDIPAGWTRENQAIGKFEGVELKSPAGDAVHLYVTTPGQAFASMEAWFRWKNHRHWNDELTLEIIDEKKLADGWVANVRMQTRVRPTPDTGVYSTRRIAGRDVDCVVSQPKQPSTLAAAMTICASARFDPNHGPGSAYTKPPADWQAEELEAPLPLGWRRRVDHGALDLESPQHEKVFAYRTMSRDVPTLDDVLRENRIAAQDIVSKRALPDGAVVVYRVGKGFYVRGSRTIATRNFTCGATTYDADFARLAAAICVALHL